MKLIVVLVAIASLAIVVVSKHSESVLAAQKRIDIYDNCDPRDPAWAPTGGCLLDEKEGNVPLTEFNLFLTSPLSLSVVGHPSWRNEPSYLTVTPGTDVRVENEGGRRHTFTRVAEYGGGIVPPLNQGLTQAPECLASASSALNPGQGLQVTGLAPGVHKFQCCIHPWMRAAIRVAPK